MRCTTMKRLCIGECGPTRDALVELAAGMSYGVMWRNAGVFSARGLGNAAIARRTIIAIWSNPNATHFQLTTLEPRNPGHGRC